MNLGHGRNVDADVFIHFYMLACLNNISKTFYVFYSYIIAVMFLLFHSGYSVFILCTHWPIAMFDVYDFNLCVFYHVLGQRWPNKRVQSIKQISVKFESKGKIFHSQKILEDIVCEMVVILPSGDELTSSHWHAIASASISVISWFSHVWTTMSVSLHLCRS